MPVHLLHAGFLRASFSTLKMEVICSSEMSVHIGTTPHYTTENDNIRNYYCDNLTSYTSLKLWVPLWDFGAIIFARKTAAYCYLWQENSAMLIECSKLLGIATFIACDLYLPQTLHESRIVLQTNRQTLWSETASELH
jgi:hypothetical protein